MTAIMMAMALTLAAAEPTVTTAPASQAAIPGYDGIIRQTIDRALQQYVDAKSYEDVLVSSLELEVEGPQSLPSPEPRRTSLAYARPNRLALRTPTFSVLCDGKMLREAVNPWMQYVETPAAKELRLQDLALTKFPFFEDNGHLLVAFFLQAGKPGLGFLGNVKRLDTIRAELLNGRPGQRIIGVVQQADIRTDLVLEIWIDDKTGLFGEIIYDQTQAIRESAAKQGFKLKKYLLRCRFSDFRINEPVADDRFAMKPDPNLDKVARLTMPTSQEVQQRMTGRRAVEFAAKDLEGKKMTSADLKGRVVMLDFWSLRCGPCIMALPILQKVADKFADKPVSIIGVNTDGEAASSRASSLLKDRNIKFRQLIQTQPTLAEKYFVQGIPCSVFIDAKGTIQLIHVGMASEEHLTMVIGKLLKGENLYAKN